jgi:WD40 repeat protein
VFGLFPSQNLFRKARGDCTIQLLRIGWRQEYVVPDWLPQTRDYGVYCLNRRFAAISKGTDECVHVDLDEQQWQAIAPAPSSQLAAMGLTLDGRTLAVADARGNLELWDVPTRKAQAVLRSHTTCFRCLAFDQNGTLLATASDAPDNAIRLWDVTAKRLLRTFGGGEFNTECLAFSPDGRLLASGNGDSVARLWDLNQQNTPAELRGHSAGLRAVAFSPDGRLLASASDDSTVRIWDVTSHRDVGLILRHPERVGSVTFSPDDPLVITGCDDSVVRLWNVNSGELVAELRGHTGHVNHFTFDPDGRWLASAANEREQPLLLWPAHRVD